MRCGKRSKHVKTSWNVLGLEVDGQRMKQQTAEVEIAGTMEGTTCSILLMRMGRFSCGVGNILAVQSTAGKDVELLPRRC